MSKQKALLLLTVFLLIPFLASTAVAGGHGGKKAHQAVHIEGGDYVTISGTIIDSHKEPVGEAVVEFEMGGHPITEVETAGNGHYVAEFMVEKDALRTTPVEIKVHKTSFASKTVHASGDEFAQRGNHYYVAEEIALDRVLGPAFWISTIVFILAYVLIAFELTS